MRTRTDNDSSMHAQSPCINVCTLDRQSGLCLGCWRTLAEITAWSRSSNSEKLEILAAATRRRQPGQTELTAGHS